MVSVGSDKRNVLCLLRLASPLMRANETCNVGEGVFVGLGIKRGIGGDANPFKHL
jgi:hypothetical protein